MDTLCSFTPISLTKLESHAAFLDRKEKKYLIHRDQFFSILPYFLPYFCLLTIGDKNIFTYDTIWFDTPDFAYYLEHHNGKRLRKKIRTRLYTDTNLAFLEIKFKHYNKTLKQRMQISPQQHGILSEESFSFLSKHHMQFYNKPFEDTLLPTIRVIYKRITLVDYMYRERITFDYDISWIHLRSDKIQLYTQPNMVIVETKGTGIHSYANDVLCDLKYKPITTFSKYSIGVCLLQMAPKMNEFKQLVKKVRMF